MIISKESFYLFYSEGILTTSVNMTNVFIFFPFGKLHIKFDMSLYTFHVLYSYVNVCFSLLSIDAETGLSSHSCSICTHNAFKSFSPFKIIQ